MNLGQIFLQANKINKLFSRHLLVKANHQSISLNIVEAREILKTIVGSPQFFGDARDSSASLTPLPSSQVELPSKRMIDSYREAIIPIGRDRFTREKYLLTIAGVTGIRHGRFLENLDTMAVLIGYSHNMDLTTHRKSPIVIVTALVDSIHFQSENISHEKDIYIRGHVTWAGSTSLEIQLVMEQENVGVIKEFLRARFLMVARDPSNKKKAFVNPLLVETAEEKALFDLGKAHKEIRGLQAQTSLAKIAPNSNEMASLHDLFLKTMDSRIGWFNNSVAPAGCIWLSDSGLKTVYTCFPENRNLYNKIFGGYLMRKALELARANATVFCNERPMIKFIDDIMFTAPVEIGSLLLMASKIVFTHKNSMQVRVHARVLNPATGVSHTTNTFHLTFDASKDVPTVMPRTYAEFMEYLEGKRHFEHNK